MQAGINSYIVGCKSKAINSVDKLINRINSYLVGCKYEISTMDTPIIFWN